MPDPFIGVYAKEILPLLKKEVFVGTADFVLACLKQYDKPEKSRVLDICCGDLSDSDFLFRQGYQTYALDVSETLCEMAHKKNKYVNFIWSDAESSKWKHQIFPYRIDLAFCLYSFYLLNHPQKMIENVYDVLHHGGIFVVDFYNRKAFKEGESERFDKVGDFDRHVVENVVDGVRSAKYSYTKEKREKIVVEHDSKLYRVHAVNEMLLKAGFVVEEHYPFLDFGSFDEENDKVCCIVARKV